MNVIFITTLLLIVLLDRAQSAREITSGDLPIWNALVAELLVTLMELLHVVRNAGSGSGRLPTLVTLFTSYRGLCLDSTGSGRSNMIYCTGMYVVCMRLSIFIFYPVQTILRFFTLPFAINIRDFTSRLLDGSW